MVLQAMASDQRLAAILFTDIVGYTALMGSNEGEAMELLRVNRAIHSSKVSEFGGVYVKEIGDGTLAYFNSAYEAVSCAISIQQSAREKLNAKLRMGIHLGEVFFENDDIFGDGVNIASRIEPLAEPGGIAVSEAVEVALNSFTDIQTKYLGKARLKNVVKPIGIYSIAGHGLSVLSKKKFAEKSKRRKAVSLKPVNILLYGAIPLLVIAGIYFWLENRNKINQARSTISRISQIIDTCWRDYSVAYNLAKETQKIIPQNQILASLIKKSSVDVDITTEPSGVQVYVKEFDHPEKGWRYIGITPLEKTELPISILRWLFVKEGYDTVKSLASTYQINREIKSNWTKNNIYMPNRISRVLDRTGSIPADMVRVSGHEMPYGKLQDFYIDKYEVRNKDYKRFVDSGGYQNLSYWKYDIVGTDGKEMDKLIAIASFVDRSGQPGPATWEAGTYPEGQGNFPVSGISWYEANAYASFVGKSLPTVDHWGLARGDGTMVIDIPQVGGAALFVPYSNYNQKGPVATGSLPGISSYGAYDMAGNVREWCWNESPMGRSIRGGAWNDNTYSFRQPIQAPALDRSETNGFRCAYYLYPDSIPPGAYAQTKNFRASVPVIPPPVPDQTLEEYKTLYGYDKSPLNPKLLYHHEDSKDWVLEKVEFDAAYGEEKIPAYLFLPRNVKPPYQTVVYMPGVAVFWQPSSEDITHYYEFPVFLDYIVKTGRAVIFPVYTGTFERMNNYSLLFQPDPNKHRTFQFTEYTTHYFKDFSRTIDYLETRQDIDTGKIALYGMSHGTVFLPIFSVLDPRVKVNVMVSGGCADVGRPEANSAYYYGKMKKPTLMVNGRFDSVLGEEDIENTFQHIGSKEKALKFFETDHIPPRSGMVKETLAWLDKYLGPVK